MTDVTEVPHPDWCISLDRLDWFQLPRTEQGTLLAPVDPDQQHVSRDLRLDAGKTFAFSIIGRLLQYAEVMPDGQVAESAPRVELTIRENEVGTEASAHLEVAELARLEAMLAKLRNDLEEALQGRG